MQQARIIMHLLGIQARKIFLFRIALIKTLPFSWLHLLKYKPGYLFFNDTKKLTFNKKVIKWILTGLPRY